MCRTITTTFVLAALAAWASAQGPPRGESAGERLTRFTRNRVLLETLVDRGLDLSQSDAPLRRARVCQEAAAELGGRLREAATTEDIIRIAELSEYLGALVNDGLLPNLTQARTAIPAGSPDEGELWKIRDEAKSSLVNADASMTLDAHASLSNRIRDARNRLTEARTRLGQVP